MGDREIIELVKKDPNTVTEQEIKNVLNKYGLGQALFCFAALSKMLFDIRSGTKTDYEILGIGGIRNPTTGVIITEYALAYLASIFILSGTNDWKSKQFVAQGKNNIEILINVYNNCLVSGNIASGERTDEERNTNAKSILIRLFHEQLTLQFEFMDMMARNYVFFCKIVKDNPSYSYLLQAFEDCNGINIEDYFYISLAIFGISTSKPPLFTIGQLTGADNVEHYGKLTQENVDAFMRMRSANYTKIRELDSRRNANQMDIYTRTRFNPLSVYPIVEMQKSIGGKEYVIPNMSVYVKSVFDLFWHFDDYFSSISPSEQTRFRNSFGEIFEEYVGEVLKSIYGDENVKGEITYITPDGEVKFLDYYVEVGSKIYIFEVKANRFRLPTLQAGLESGLLDEEIKKFTKPILQVKKRFVEIDHHPELAMFRGKELIPVIIFADIPFINDPNFYENVLDKTDIGKEAIAVIKELNIRSCNIADIEKYSKHSESITLEDVFKEMEKNPKTHSISSVSNMYPRNKTKDFLTKEFESFHQEVMKIAELEAVETNEE